MPRVDRQVEVAITDNGVQNGKHLWTIKVEAAAEPLLLSDLLVKEGVIKPVNALFKTANRKALADYILAGRSLIKQRKGERAPKEARLEGGKAR